MKRWKRKWRLGRDMVWLLVGVAGCVPWPRGIACLHYFPSPCQLRTVHCTGFPVKSQTYYPEHILAYRRGKAYCSLVMGSGSFWSDWLEAGIGGGLSTTLRLGLKCGSLESKFGQDPKPVIGVERVGLARAWGASEACVFWGTQLGILIHKSPFLCDSMAWLHSGTVVRTGIWKMEKWFWLLNPCLIIEQVLT
jgi:hypothetical protein